MNRNLREAMVILQEVAGRHGGVMINGPGRARDVLSRPPFAKRQKAPRKALREPTRKAAKEGKRAKHREETASLRGRAWARSGGTCEACDGFFTSFDPGEMDHLESGSGVRRQRQSIRNVWMVCHRCHLFRTEAPHLMAVAVRAWADEHGYPVPRRYR